jgi:hypothetical protein
MREGDIVHAYCMTFSYVILLPRIQNVLTREIMVKLYGDCIKKYLSVVYYFAEFRHIVILITN